MHLLAHFVLLAGLAFSAGLALYIVVRLFQGKPLASPIFEWTQAGVTGCLLMASAVLLWALIQRDFSYEYVGAYTDTFLPLFYVVTAFWAGQSGSLLFWAMTTATCGLAWTVSPHYRRLPADTKSYYWLVFLSIQAFFLFLLTGPTNPFMKVVPAPAQGTGLNPLLQNPAMIFHPPILFMGYAGFTIPVCLMLASILSGQGRDWLRTGRNWFILSWIFLSIGIILGGWWSYMELGWGGYWAWDPVENASLVPWLTASAYLHTSAVARARGGLHRTNVLLLGMTLVLCYIATYIVRSGVIDSLHAFGGGAVAIPLLVFVLAGTGLIFFCALGFESDSAEMGSVWSRPGLMVIVALTLTILGAVILLGTLWPAISRLWTDTPQGLDARFYNRVCLPFFTSLAVFIAVCPWLSWRGGLERSKFFYGLIGFWVASLAVLFIIGVRDVLPLISAGSALAGVASFIVLAILDPGVRRTRRSWGFWGAHVGLCLMVLGVAFSGPYQLAQEAVLEPGREMAIGPYRVVYVNLTEQETPAVYTAEARLEVKRDGRIVGTLLPQRRMYRNFEQPFAEASVIPGLGDEVYATLLAFTPEKSVSVKVSVHPLINWIWIGSTIMCVATFLCLTRMRIGQASQE